MSTPRGVLVKVSLSYTIFEPLTYRFDGEPEMVQPGQRVVVPLMNRLATGWVMAVDSQYTGRVKSIVGVMDDGYIPAPHFMEFADAVSAIYFTSAGSLLDSSVSPKSKALSAFSFEGEKGIEKYKNQPLKVLQPLAKRGPLRFFIKSRNQKESSDVPVLVAKALEPTQSTATTCFLLSSDRLAFYAERIRETLARQESVLIVVPDNFTAAYIKEALAGQDVAVDIYNSEMKLADREKIWQGYVQEGRVGVVTGGLSAALLPIGNLGLIIAERAGSANYKRLAYSKFNTLLLAQLRAKYEQVPLLEGFSTYTVYAYNNRELVPPLDKREEQVLANVHMIPGGLKGIPESLVELVGHYFQDNKKILLLVNRKGSTDFLYCGKCKKVSRCPQCDGLLDVAAEFCITCTQCGFKQESFNVCPVCRGNLTVVQDISMTSLVKVLSGRVVETGIITLSAEDLKIEDLSLLRQHVVASKLVIATPMLINPFFKGMFDVVIYIRPESYVNLDEYDAAERVFSLVAEMKEMVASGGVVDIFSTFHFFYSLKLANDEEAFFERELKYREWFRLPPFCNVYHIEIKGKVLRELAQQMRDIYIKEKERLGIKKIYLNGRAAVRGNYKGTMEAHALPQAIRESGLLSNRDISISLELS